MLEKKELIIPALLMDEDWSSDKVVITEYDTETAGKIKDAGIRTNLSNSGLSGTVNMEALVVESVRLGVVEAPWMNSSLSVADQRKVISKLRNKLTMWVFREIEALNSIPEVKKNNSEDGV